MEGKRGGSDAIREKDLLAGFWVHSADGRFSLSGAGAALAVQTCLLFILGDSHAFFFIIADKGWACGTSKPAGASAGLPDWRQRRARRRRRGPGRTTPNFQPY